MCNFVTIMRRIIPFTIYWAASLILLAIVLCSTGYRMSEALLMSTSLMPIAILFRQMTARISFAANRSKAVKSLICILLFTLTMAILAVHLAHVAILYFYHQIPNWRLGVPPMLLNPVFLLAIFVLLTLGDYSLGRVLEKRMPESKETITFSSDCQSVPLEGQENPSQERQEPITFISNRQSMTLTKQEILYIESCDTEVWVHATGNRRFRNKTAISSWARLLGPEYLRIHRSYLVRLSACTGIDRDNVIIDNTHLPISRKYKEMVQQLLKDSLTNPMANGNRLNGRWIQESKSELRY